MKLYNGLTIVLFTLKMLGLLSHGWLVVFSPTLIGFGLEFLFVCLNAVLEQYKRR